MADYKIKLETEADTSGAQVTEEAIDSVAEATKRAADESKKAGDDEAKAARRLAFELNLVEQRAKAVATAFEEMPPNPFGGQLTSGGSGDEVETIKRTTDAVDQQTEAQRRLAESEKNANEDLRKAIDLRKQKTDGLDKEADATRKVSGQVSALALAQGAAALGQFAAGIRDMAQGLSEVDPKLAKTLDNVGSFGQGLADVGAQAAQGFAVGGPWGAAIAGGLALLSQGFKTITQDAVDTQKAMADGEQRAETMAQKLQTLAEKTAGLKLDSQYQASWKNLQGTVDVVNQSIRDHLALKAQIAGAENAVADSSRSAQEEIIRAQSASGAITAQAAQAQLAALRREEAEQNKAAAMADAQRRQSSIEADLQAAKTQLEAIETRRDKAQNDLNNAREEWDKIADDPRVSRERKGEALAAISGAEKELEAAKGELDQAQQRIITAGNAVQAGKESLAVEITKIEAVAANAETQGKVTELAKKLDEAEKESARKISESIAAVEPQTQRQAEALEVLKKALSDGEITASESKAVAQAISDMSGAINGNVNELINVAFKVQQVQAANNAQIQQLKAQVSTLQQSVSQQFDSQ